MSVKNIVSFGNLRNQTLYEDRDSAILGLKSEGINDGVIKLARYRENGQVRTLFGVSYTPDSGATTYTVYESYKEAIDDIWKAFGELKGEVSEDYDSLEKIESKIKENYENGKVTMTSYVPEESGGTIAKSYKLFQGGVSIGDIDIYKNSFLKEVQLVDKDGRIIDDDHPGVAEYIRFIFTLSDGTDSVVNVPLGSFIQDLEAGKGLVVDSEGRLNIVKDDSSEDFLEINEDSIAIVGVQDAIDNGVQEVISQIIETINEKVLELEDKIDDIEVIGSNSIGVEKNESGRKTTVFLKLADVDESPLLVNENGLFFSSELDCGYYDM